MKCVVIKLGHFFNLSMVHIICILTLFNKDIESGYIVEIQMEQVIFFINCLFLFYKKKLLVPITGTLRWITHLRRENFLDDISNFNNFFCFFYDYSVPW